MDGLKRILISLLVLIIAALLFSNPEPVRATTSIDEIIEIIDKDSNVKDEEIIVDEDLEIEKSNKNVFVLIVEGVSSIFLGVLNFVFSLITKLVASL